MSKNSEGAKPEWFQLVDNDAPSAQVRKVSKKLPAFALIVSSVLIATGTFFASGSEVNLGVGQAVASAASSIGVGSLVADSSPTQLTSGAQGSAVVAGAPASVQNPGMGGIKPPTGGDDDDDDDDYEGDDD